MADETLEKPENKTYPILIMTDEIKEWPELRRGFGRTPKFKVNPKGGHYEKYADRNGTFPFTLEHDNMRDVGWVKNPRVTAAGLVLDAALVPGSTRPDVLHWKGLMDEGLGQFSYEIEPIGTPQRIDDYLYVDEWHFKKVTGTRTPKYSTTGLMAGVLTSDTSMLSEESLNLILEASIIEEDSEMSNEVQNNGITLEDLGKFMDERDAKLQEQLDEMKASIESSKTEKDEKADEELEGDTNTDSTTDNTEQPAELNASAATSAPPRPVDYAGLDRMYDLALKNDGVSDAVATEKYQEAVAKGWTPSELQASIQDAISVNWGSVNQNKTIQRNNSTDYGRAAYEAVLQFYGLIGGGKRTTDYFSVSDEIHAGLPQTPMALVGVESLAIATDHLDELRATIVGTTGSLGDADVANGVIPSDLLGDFRNKTGIRLRFSRLMNQDAGGPGKGWRRGWNISSDSARPVIESTSGVDEQGNIVFNRPEYSIKKVSERRDFTPDVLEEDPSLLAAYMIMATFDLDEEFDGELVNGTGTGGRVLGAWNAVASANRTTGISSITFANIANILEHSDEAVEQDSRIVLVNQKAARTLRGLDRPADVARLVEGVESMTMDGIRVIGSNVLGTTDNDQYKALALPTRNGYYKRWGNAAFLPELIRHTNGNLTALVHYFFDTMWVRTGEMGRLSV